MKAEGSVKQEHIVEAAIKRFAHFGINKTTLAEIAEDLAISKPSLFYYFNDKNSLIAAVAEKIINECLEEYEATLKAAPSVEDGLLALVDVKRAFFKKYFLLAIQGDSIDINKVSTIQNRYMVARDKTALLITHHLNTGVNRGELKPMDTAKTTHLLLETFSAFEECIKNRKALPEMKDIDEMFDKQKEVLRMFLNGLKTSDGRSDH